ncbi:MAG TPA: hypothetical protein VFP12_16395 [Allosphingosinicella sp.]|nr:hypothetical protein [Allosphingosinicella sp.]
MKDHDLHNMTIAAGLVLLGLAACDAAPTRNESASNEAANVAAAAPAPAPAAAIVLEGAGLRIPSANPPRTLAFGMPAAEAVEALAKALGRPPTERGANEECGGGSMEFAAWEGEVTLWLLDGRFAGWDNKGGLKTLDGVGIGSSRPQVAALPGFEAEESTLGTEFRAGGLSGILASRAPDAKVTHLWGGATCVFR